MHYLARRPLPWLAVCIVAAILLAAEKSSESAHATIGHQFGYPFCAQQPYVLAGFDHSFPHLQEIVPKNPTAESNRLVTYYNNDVRIDCGEAEFQTNYSNPSGPCWRYDGHTGWDYKLTATNGGIEGAIGYAPVYAADDGTVQYAGREDPLNDLEPYGQMIQIAHADEGNGEFDSEYLHLEAMFVETGADVEKGAIIGLSGMTGAAGAMPHLHFQVREHRNNPEGGGAEMLYQPWFPYFDPYGWDTDYTGAAQAAATPSAPDPWPTTFHGSGPGGTPPGPAAISEGRRLILPSAPDNMNVCPIKCAPVNVPPIVVDDSDEGFTVISGDWTVRTGAGENNEFRVTRPSGITDTITAEVEWDFGSVSTTANFVVEIHLPPYGADTVSEDHRGTLAARYSFSNGGNDSIVDQFTTDPNFGVRGKWIAIGFESFPSGQAKVRLNNNATVGDDSKIGLFVDGRDVESTREVIADAARITQLCTSSATPTATFSPTPTSIVLFPTPTRTPTPQ